MPGKETNQFSSLFRVQMQNYFRGQEPELQKGKSAPFPVTERKFYSSFKEAKN